MCVEEEKNMLKKAQGLLLLFVIAFAPLVFSRHTADPFWAVEQFFFRFSMSLLCVLALIRVFTERSFTLFKTPYNIAFAGFMILSLPGIFVAKNIYAFLGGFYTNFLYIVLFFFTLDYVSDEEENLNKALAAIIAPAVLMAAYGILQSLGIDFVPWQTNFSYRAASTLGNPNFLAGHMVLVIPLVYAMLVSLEGKNRLLIMFSALLLTAALVLSQTRGAYLAYIVGMAALVPMLFKADPENMKKYGKAAVVFFVLVALAGGAYVAMNKNAKDRIISMMSMKDREAGIRTRLWKNTLYMIKDNFFLGSGAGNFPGKYSYYQSRSMKAQEYADAEYYKTGHAHNDFLQFIAEYGAPAAGFMFLFFGLFFYTGFKSLKNPGENPRLSAGVLAGGAGLVVHGMFNFPFIIIPTTAVFYALAAAVLVPQDDYDFNEKEVPAGAAVSALAASALFIAAAVIFAQCLLSNAYLRASKENDHFKNAERAAYFAGKAVLADPWSGENLSNAGLVYEKTGDVEKSYENYKAAFVMDPGAWDANISLFNYYVTKNMSVEALIVGENMYRISPYALRAVTAAGYANYINAKHERALEIYLKALPDRPDNYELLYHLSAVYGAIGDTANAAVYANRAVAASKENQGAYYNLAVAYYKTGDRAKAIETLNAMLREHPGDAKALELLKAVKK